MYVSETVYERPDDVRISVHYYPVDGADVYALRKIDDEWTGMYGKRVIADSLYELLDGALYECGIDDEARMSILETWGVELPNDDDE